MSNIPTPPVPPVPPPPVTPEYLAAGPDRQRPWWGPVDVFLGVLFVIAAMVVGAVVSAIAVAIAGDDFSDEPVYALFFATLVFQLGQFGWPWIVSKWKGLGVASDWKFRFSFP